MLNTSDPESISSAIAAAVCGGEIFLSSCMHSFELHSAADLNLSLVSASRAFLPVDQAPPASLGLILNGLQHLNIQCTDPSPSFVIPLLQQLGLMLSASNASLRTISITKCKLTGPISSVNHFVPLVTEFLDLSRNWLTGPIPSSWIKSPCNSSPGPCYLVGNVSLRLAINNPGLEEDRSTNEQATYLFWSILAASLTLAAFILTVIILRHSRSPSMPASRRIPWPVEREGEEGLVIAVLANTQASTTVVRRASANGPMGQWEQ
jgi:hypothetical protein